MSVYPDEIHDLGQRLIDKNPNLCNSGEPLNKFDQCIFRTVIDRSYYSAFLTAREWLINNKGFQPTRKGKDHHLVRQELKTSGLPNANGLAGRLSRLHKERKQACYDINGGFSKFYSKTDAVTVLNSAKRFNNVFSSTP